MRTKKAIRNTIAGLSREVIEILCALIVPRLILTTFGSDYNGLASSINQFLRVAILLHAGLGGVIQAALYKPLADKNIDQIGVVIKTATNYFRKIAVVYVGIALALAVSYPFAVIDDFDWFFTFSLVLIMSLGTFLSLTIAGAYGFLISAKQKHSIVHIIDTVILIISTIVSVVLINSGFGIHAVKLGSVLVFSLRPLCYYIYAKRNYKFSKSIKTDNSLIKQRWDNFAQEFATFVSGNTCLIAISLFTNVYEVSVYTVYMLVIKGIMGVVYPVVAGIDAAFGDMFAKKEEANIIKGLRVFEMVVFAVTTFLFSVTLVMAVPFIMLYTRGVTDAEYNRQLFPMLLVLLTMFRCFRLPYVALVGAVGHFKQTRNYAIAEMALTVISSVVLALLFGIVGAVIGTLIPVVVRTVQYALYISKHIVKRSIMIFVKRIVLSLSSVAVIACMGHFFGLGFNSLSPDFSVWFVNAALTTLLAAGVVVSVEVIFYGNDIHTMIDIYKRSRKLPAAES